MDKYNIDKTLTLHPLVNEDPAQKKKREDLAQKAQARSYNSESKWHESSRRNSSSNLYYQTKRSLIKEHQSQINLQNKN